MLHVQSEASVSPKRNSMNTNLNYRISTKKEKTEIIEPEGLKYLIRRVNEKREFMWKNKNHFDLKQEILLRNAQLQGEIDLQKLKPKLSGDGSDIAGTQCLNFLVSSYTPSCHQQRHYRRSHSIQYVPYMKPVLTLSVIVILV